MKKIISLILSAMMLFSLTTAVFAREADNSDMSTEETYTFDELTDISQKNKPSDQSAEGFSININKIISC